MSFLLRPLRIGGGGSGTGDRRKIQIWERLEHEKRYEKGARGESGKESEDDVIFPLLSDRFHFQRRPPCRG